MTSSDPVLHALRTRRSISKVGPGAPTDAELLDLIGTITTVADHKALKPWRLMTIRGEDRARLGSALDEAAGVSREPGETNPKPFRADLLLAIIASPVDHPKVPTWEQHATAAGAAHLLELALWQAGWGVMWRSGLHANATPVRALHGLAEHELLMGWLYIGTIAPEFKERLKTSSRPVPPAADFLCKLPAANLQHQHPAYPTRSETNRVTVNPHDQHPAHPTRSAANRVTAHPQGQHPAHPQGQHTVNPQDQPE